LHSRDEIHAVGLRDLRAIVALLGDKPFLMGPEPTEIDTVAYGFLANILKVPIASPIKDEGLRQANLVAYVDRAEARFRA
jgi:glutathione S-transferase